MRRKILRFAAIIMVFAIMATSCITASAAANDMYVGTLNIKKLLNPIYHTEEETSSTYSLRSQKYYALVDEDPFDTTLCTDDNTVIGEDIREIMADRGDSLTVYFKSTVQQTGGSLYDYLVEWSEIAFLETENSYEGDYLRYVYDGITPGEITVLYDGAYYYYEIPLDFDYYTTKAQEDALADKIDEVIDDFGFTAASTNRQKSDKIYRYITDNVEYDYDNLNDESYKLKFTAYAAMMNGTAVCQGYATLYYRMARECGLDTRIITGKSYGENHAWNIVKLGDYYYYIDSTWDAGNSEYRYYLKCAEDFSNHTPEDKYLTADFTAKYPLADESMDLTSAIGNQDGFAYEIYNSEAYIFAYGGDDEHVIVPGEICGYPVKQVNKGVFDRKPNIKSITFCEGIKRMGESAIEACENLTAVHFPSTMQIDYEKYTDSVKGGYTTAPIYCSKLETVTVANGNPYMKVVDGILYSLDEKAVILCPDAYKKDKVTILDGVVDIAPFAFNGCENLKEVKMPDTVKMIGFWAFCSASNLSEVEISDDCRFIGQFAFANTKIEEIHIPEKVDTILGSAFGMETDLKEITVDYENQAFYMENGALIYYNSENETRTILDYETGNSATAFTIPSNVWEIEQYAFAQAQNLEKVLLHDGVEHIWGYAFENCDSLTHFEFPESVEEVHDYVLLNCDNIMSVIIPSSVTQIGDMLVHDNNGYTIYGENGSVAETYAANNSLKFKEINEFLCTSGHTVQKQDISELAYHNVCTVCGDAAKTVVLGDIGSIAQDAKTQFDEYKYTGKEIKPQITTFQTPDGVPLVEGVDYEITGYFCNVNVGTAYIEVKGIGSYGGTGYIYFQITPLPLSEAEIGIEYLTTVYDGYEKCPIITIEGLNEFEDFQVTYENNINPGTARAIITAWGNYEGSVYVEFEIVEMGDRLVEEGGKYYLYRDGAKSNFTGLVEIDDARYYIVNGQWANTVKGVVNIDGKDTYINKGYFTGASGLVTVGGKKMYISKGYFLGASGLVTISGKKAYINKGYFTGASGLVTINGKKMYINKGYFTGASGLVTIKGKKMYISKGYFLGASGFVTIGKKKAYINKGYFLGASGIVKVGGKRYYINKGYFTGASGKVRVGGKTYKVVKGIVK